MNIIFLSVNNPIFNWWNGTTLAACLIIPLLILTKARSNERLVAYIPPLCTSIGIFFTFLILFITLGVEFGKVNLTGTNSLKETIQQLSLKFSCSLLGIFFSIFWSIIIKVGDGRIEAKQKVQHSWKQKDPQELLWELTQVQPQLIAAIGENRGAIENGFASHGEQRDSQHNEFMGKIDNLGTFIQTNLQQSFTNFNDLLKKHIEQMGAEALANSKTNIETILTKLSELSKELLENHKNSLKETLEDIGETVNNFKPVMEDFISKLEILMRKQQENAGQNNKTIEDGFKSISDEMIQQFNANASELNEALGKITQTISSMDEKVQSSSQKVLQNHLEQIESTFKSLEEMQSRAKTILEETTGQFVKAVEEYKDVQSSNGEVLNRIEEQIEILSRLQENAKLQLDLWSEQAEEVETMRNRLNDIGNVVDQLQDLNTRLSKVVAISNNNHL